jgi:hypothetical protein
MFKVLESKERELAVTKAKIAEKAKIVESKEKAFR